MTAVAGDIALEGFGAATANWTSFQGARVFRVLRASLAPIEVLGIDIGLQIAAAATANQLIQAGPVAIWRSSIGQKDPPNTFPAFAAFTGGSSPTPAGFELLWGRRLFATFQMGTGAPQTMGSEFSHRFPSGTMVAAQGQQLIVSCGQPVALSGADFYPNGSGGIILAVMGIDYGLSKQGNVGIPTRSVPRF